MNRLPRFNLKFQQVLQLHDYKALFPHRKPNINLPQDILRCSIELHECSELENVYKMMEEGVTVQSNGQQYILELARCKNKFSLEKLGPSRLRSLLLNVRLTETKTQSFVFGEVQIKLHSVMELMHAHNKYI